MMHDCLMVTTMTTGTNVRHSQKVQVVQSSHRQIQALQRYIREIAVELLK